MIIFLIGDKTETERLKEIQTDRAETENRQTISLRKQSKDRPIHGQNRSQKGELYERREHQTERQKTQTVRETEKQICRQINRHASQADRLTDSQADEIDKHIERKTVKV